MKLSPGEIICDKCDGSGRSIAHHLCEKCIGAGKLDWIEAVVGKKSPIIWGQKTLKPRSRKLNTK